MTGDSNSMAGGHASYVFLLDDAGGIHPLPHGLYVALAKGEATAPEFAGRHMRLADWYVRLDSGAPSEVLNETYAPMVFDDDGRPAHRVPPPAAPGHAAWRPTRAERARMWEVVFGAGPEDND